MKTLVLASSSPRRKEILERTGLPFIVEVGEYEEDMLLNLPPRELVMHLALGKALAVGDRHLDAIIIGADTVVVIDDVILGKPHTPDRACEMLQRLSGRKHMVVTGYAILDPESGTSVVDSVEVKVFFREMSNEEIDWYVASGEPLDRAGGYAMQGVGGMFIERVDGDYVGAVGLPLSSLIQTLKKFDIDPFSQQ